MRQQDVSTRIFLHGPAGSGKTTWAVQHVLGLLEAGIPAERILVLVPQRTLGQPYSLAIKANEAAIPGNVTMVTLSGLARRNLERFWPLVAEPADFEPASEPVFLTIETAQYYMMRFVRAAVREGVFDSISLSPPRIAAQLLDNMAKAAIAGFPFEEVVNRLVTAWADRGTSRAQVYRISHQISLDYRAYCLKNNLLDYAVQLEVFARHLLPHPVFQRYFRRTFTHLVADNVEEAGPMVHDFVRVFWDHWQSALLVYDDDAGFRTFLGADPGSAAALRDLCSEVIRLDAPVVQSPSVLTLEYEVQRVLNPGDWPASSFQVNPLEALSFDYHIYYPQMLDWVADRIVALVAEGTPPGQIVVLAPFLNDSLRFSLQNRLERAGIPSRSHRPSRALRDEPAARVLLTLLSLAHPQWDFVPPPRSDVADMLALVIDGLDPVRARLLADIVYRPQTGGELASFDQIQAAVRERITYTAGERYERLRVWLLRAMDAAREQPVPVDYFLQRLFGEVLSQPGFGFHTNLDAGRTAAQMIESARKFRQVLYPFAQTPDWDAAGKEYLQLVNEGVLAALYTTSWEDDEQNAVFLAPAFTYLMRNRPTDYQFWLDVGSASWWERLDQPLTHPYVLMRDYPPDRPWTDEDEVKTQREMLRHVVIGLLRRCRKGVFLGMADLNEQGYEQRGPMLFLFQQILQRYGLGDTDAV